MMKDFESSEMNIDFRPREAGDNSLVHDQTGDAYSEGYDGHLRPSVLMKLACGEPVTSDILDHFRDCEDDRCVKRLVGFCERFGRELPPWLATRREEESKRRLVLAPMRLAASTDDQNVLAEWTITRSHSTSRNAPVNATVLRVERDVSAIGDETVMIRLDWQDERGRVLVSSLGVLDRSLPVVTDEGMKTRVRFADVSVPDSIASVPGASLTNIKVVSSLDDIGLSAMECLTHSLTQSLNLGLTKWNAWAKALERVLEHSPKVPDEVEAKVRLILSACRTQCENKEDLKRFNSAPSLRLEWQDDLFATGMYRANVYNSFAASVSVLSLLAHYLR